MQELAENRLDLCERGYKQIPKKLLAYLLSFCPLLDWAR